MTKEVAVACESFQLEFKGHLQDRKIGYELLKKGLQTSQFCLYNNKYVLLDWQISVFWGLQS